jgi:(S)-2-hydroxyglutarate dehydrogenase
MAAECDVAVVGGGILGVAVARELASRRPQRRVVVLEREPELGAHQTSHNSGVIHAGIYYAPGSLKARLCVSGARELYELCERRGVTHERCGKVIVARDRSELPRLDELERRGRANGVAGLRRLGAAELRELEPHCRGVAALHSPATGIVDFAAVARALASEAEERGVQIRTRWPVESVGGAPGRVELGNPGAALTARVAVFCAGAFADRLAAADGASPDPRIVPFRGAYMRVRRPQLVRGLIYPVPDPRLPFLGVHLSRHLGGEVSLGPTALVVGARDAYAVRRVRPRDVGDTLAWPGTWRMVARFWRTGVTELRHALSRRSLARAAASYVPAIEPDDLEPWFAGVRAQAVGRDGRLIDDFVVSRTERALHVRNAPSPAATSVLALARLIGDEVERSLP